jgi:hypothetical protein
MSNEVILDKVYIAAANAAVEEFTYGSVISKHWLLKQLSLTEPGYGSKAEFQNFAFEFMQLVESFKAYLLEEHKMLLVSKRGAGYLIVMPNQQSDVAMARLRGSVQTEIKRAISTLTHINEDLLSLDDIKRRDENQGRIAALSAFSSKRIATK